MRKSSNYDKATVKYEAAIKRNFRNFGKSVGNKVTAARDK